MKIKIITLIILLTFIHGQENTKQEKKKKLSEILKMRSLFQKATILFEKEKFDNLENIIQEILKMEPSNKYGIELENDLAQIKSKNITTYNLEEKKEKWKNFRNWIYEEQNIFKFTEISHHTIKEEFFFTVSTTSISFLKDLNEYPLDLKEIKISSFKSENCSVDDIIKSFDMVGIKIYLHPKRLNLTRCKTLDLKDTNLEEVLKTVLETKKINYACSKTLIFIFH